MTWSTTNLLQTGFITPAALTADVNDYGPAGGDSVTTWRISGNNPFRAITGIAFPLTGRILTLVNVGTVVIQLRNESASSASANRLSLPGDIRLDPGRAITLNYDAALTRWVAISPIFPDPIDPSAPWELVDEFLTSNTTTGNIGDLGWKFTGGSVANSVSTQNNPGLITRTSGTVANGVADLRLNATTASGGFRFDEFDENFWRHRLTGTTADFTIRFGFADNPTSNPGLHGLWFERLAADTAWFGVARNNGVQSRTAALLAQDTNMHTFRIRRISATSVGFQIDRTGTEAVLTTNVPDAADVMAFVHQIIPTTVTARTCELDFFSARGAPISARW